MALTYTMYASTEAMKAARFALVETMSLLYKNKISKSLSVAVCGVV